MDTASTDHRPNGTVKPVMKLSNDDLGKPSDKPLSVVYKGMAVHLGKSSVDEKLLWYSVVSSSGPVC